jgi:hypothetical protein
MNRVSHMVFAFSLFVGLYTLLYAVSVYLSDLASLTELVWYYLIGGVAVTVVCVPILYYKAPHRKMKVRTTSDRGAVGAMTFVSFCVGSLAGTVAYQWNTGVPVYGNISIFIGALITVTGALMPDWDIPFLGISRHRNIIFHSMILPLLVVMTTVLSVTARIADAMSPLAAGAEVEYYVTALFLLGYASHLYLDIFPSDANPLEIVWRAVDIDQSAPTGLKPLGPFKIGKKGARAWLVGHATGLVFIAIFLMGLYFYNIGA